MRGTCFTNKKYSFTNKSCPKGNLGSFIIVSLCKKLYSDMLYEAKKKTSDSGTNIPNLLLKF